MIFVDTNVLIDLADRDSPFEAWSRRMIQRHGFKGIAINHVVMAELASRFSSVGALEAWLATVKISTVPIDGSTAFRAGTAYQAYRDRRGPRVTLIADFLIGAHAATLGIALLTRDPKRFSTYFPELALITPETHP